MMDYFGRLLSRTGVRLESDVEPNARSTQTPSPKAGTENPIAPVEIEEQKWVEPDWDASNQAQGDRFLPETEPPPAPPTSKPVRRPMPDEFDTPAWKEFARDAAEDREHEDQKGKRSESPSSERNRFEHRRSDPLQTDSPSEPLSPMEIIVEREAWSTEARRLSSRSVVERSTSSRKNAPIGGHSDAVQGLSHEQIKQSVYREVRRWVASQPVLSSEEQRSHVSEEAAEQVEQALQKAAERRQPASSRGRRKTGTDEAEMSVHDLHLSVGPIHITVEGPVKEPQTSKPQPKREAYSPSNGQASRLSRRYIRI